MRARGFALRDAFPDVLGGLYLQEEMEGIDAIDVTPRASYGPPSDPPPPEIEHKSEVPMNTGAFPADKTPILNPLPDEIPAKRKRATKAEMEARRAAEAAAKAAPPVENAMDQIKEGVEANLPPPGDDIPMPPEEPPPALQDDVPSHILAAIATYKNKIAVTEDPEDLDTLWAIHISGVEDQIPKWLWEECAAADDKRRGEIE